MNRSFLKDLELEDGVIDKIMSEYGKSVASEKQKADDLSSKLEVANATIDDYKEKLVNLEKVSNDSEKIKEELDNLKKANAEREEQEKAKQIEDNINKNILEAISDKEFVNERTKNSIINEVKTALMDKANTGKSAKDIFEGLVKDTTDILKNPNQISNDMPEVKDVNVNNLTSEGIKFNPMFQTF